MKIVSNINMFDLYQTVFQLVDDKLEFVGDFKLDDLPQALIASCLQYSTNKIHLYGNDKYIDILTNNIAEYNGKLYSDKIENLEIEVN